MSRIFHPLLLLIASKVDRELAKHVQYLKVENQILRARIPKQIHTTKDERARLLKFGKPLGKDIDRLITIVTPGTFHRWVREEILGRFPRMRRRNRRQLRTLVRIIPDVRYQVVNDQFIVSDEISIIDWLVNLSLFICR